MCVIGTNFTFVMLERHAPKRNKITSQHVAMYAVNSKLDMTTQNDAQKLNCFGTTFSPPLFF